MSDDRSNSGKLLRLTSFRPSDDMIGLYNHGVYFVTHHGEQIGVLLSPEMATALGLELIQAAQRFQMSGFAESEFSDVQPDIDLYEDIDMDFDDTESDEIDFDLSMLEFDDGPPN